ncbi:MAG: hypothetical protein JWP08_3653 [Bryobacterales bacterium]|jgi:hypothetical protein|nr:hypothetical protein [Bryobacterales bacterium]
MGFLDNLENSLKNLESREERNPNEARRRQEDRARGLAAAPWATQLKESDYTRALFDKAAIAGHRLRAKIYMAWLDSTLRLEARGRVLHLKPTSEGIVAEYTDSEGKPKVERIDLAGDPDELLERWLSSEQPAVKEQIDE